MKRKLLALGLLTTLAAAVASATPSGRKWFMASCPPACAANAPCTNGRCTPSFRVAASIENTGGMTLSGGSVAYSTVLQRTTEAFKNWTKSRVTACTTEWDVVSAGTFTTPSGTAAINANDRANSVIWLSAASWRYSTATLGLTTATYYTTTGEIFDADMELNNGPLWANDGRAGAFDFESVVLHEAGHFLGLDHSGTSVAVMYADVYPGEIKRVLAVPDTNDVCAVYTVPGGQGSPCTSSCTVAGLVCEGASGGTQKVCTQDCSGTGQTCPSGYTCQVSTAGFACLPRTGAVDECKFCSSGQDCTTGVCLRDLGTGVTFCSATCSDQAQCSAGYTCQMTTAGGYCVPTNGCTTQCTSGSQCPVGYTCTGGTCRPNGNVGDRCEVSFFCKDCGVCVLEPGSTTTAFCRTCCAGGMSGGLCQGCPNAMCTSPQTCVGLSNGVDSVCIGTGSAPGVCQPCQSSQCSPGLSCVAGRCHSPCNPASPGQCSACFDLGSGTGACACADEVAFEGEPCGAIAGGNIAACTDGLVCVGSPQPACRRRCVVSDPSSCPLGKTCLLMGSVAACMPGTEGSRCAPCSAGQCNAGLSCYLGRCYETCNVNVGNTCSTCVQTEASGTGVCACSDQVANVNEACGSQPSVYACQPGSLCLNGICRGECDPMAPFTCPALTDCVQIGAKYYCADSSSGGGTGGSGGSGGSGGRAGGAGGGGGGSVSSLGCGCGVSAPASVLGWALGLVVLASRRRRM